MRSGTFHHKMSSGMMKFRIGYGYDVHALGEGLPLILGGVEIEHAKGLSLIHISEPTRPY